MRVLFFHNGSDLYGASRSFLRIVTRLVADGIEVKAVFPTTGPLQDALKEAGVDVEVMQPIPLIERFAFKSVSGFSRFLWATPVSVFRICRVIRLYRPDLIHSNLSTVFTPAIAARLCRIPHIWHIRETYVEFGLFWKIYRQFMAWGSTRIIAISHSVAEQFHGKCKNKVVVLHNGYPKEEFEPVPVEKVQAFKDQFGLKNELLVGLVGRIKYVRKGQEYLVEAASILKPQFPNVKFLLIGSPFPGNEVHLTRLQELIAKLNVDDCVVYTGDADDIKAAYSALDISVMASALPEPLGGVTIESMAFEVPVIGTNIGGTIEIIEDEVSGILIPPRDPAAMANAIARLLEDDELRRRMGIAGRKRFEEKFEFKPYYKKILKLYEEVCS